MAGGVIAAVEMEDGREDKKKEEFAGDMFCMMPGNSFPQICVVSGDIISNVRKRHKSTKVLEYS